MKYWIWKNEDPICTYAGQELEKYLKKLLKCSIIRIDDPAEADFHIGSAEFGYDHWNDAFSVRSANGHIVFSGSNPRSLLFAVYDFLERLGCCWIDPWRESIPHLDHIPFDGWNIAESASKKYRGLSIMPDVELSSKQRILDIINWMPKLKYNIFFLEGFPAECPGDPWTKNAAGSRPLQHVEYCCRGRGREVLDDFNCRREEAVALARARGLLIERYGHGWAAGIEERYAELQGISRDEAVKRLQAKGNVNRRADVSGMWSQFCMSAPGLKELYICHITEYLSRHHSEVDIAAIWLGDGYDNICMCPECRQRPFSDFYMEILEAVAQECSHFAPEMRLEGLIYLATLEPPEKSYLEKLDNVDFILAPWNRCYRHRLNEWTCVIPGWEPDYRNNRSHDRARGFRPLNHEVWKCFSAWREKIGIFHWRMFEYFCLSDDLGRHRLSYDASDLARDIRELASEGFEGIVSCEGTTVYDAPLYLAHHVSAAAMWNPEVDVKLLRRRLIQSIAISTDAKETEEIMIQTAQILLLWDEHLQAPADLILKMISLLKNQLKAARIPCLIYDLKRIIWHLWIYTTLQQPEREAILDLLDCISRHEAVLNGLHDIALERKKLSARLEALEK